MKKKFRITVNSVVYDVEVEEISSQETNQESTLKPPTPTISAPKTPIQKATEIRAPPVTTGGFNVTAPISGKVTKVLKNINEVVKEGEVLLLLEAMKMQNEIITKKAGTLTFIVGEGTQVAYNDVLAIIK